MAKSAAGGTRGLSLLSGATNALFAVFVPVAVLILVTSSIWLIENDPTLQWVVSLRTALDIWFAAHGVGILVDGQTLLGIEVPDFAISYPAIGLMLIVVALGRRTAHKLHGAREYWPGWIGAISVYVGAAVLLLPLASGPKVMPNADQAVMFPVFVFAGSMILENLFGKLPRSVVDFEAVERIALREWWAHRMRRVNWFWGSISSPAFKAGTAIVLGLLAISAVMISMSLALNWIAVTRLYEGLKVSFIGAVVITLAQLVMMPNIVVYGGSWLTGVGFSIGTGSMVSPLGTQLGPIPALPILGGLPIGTNFGGLWVVIAPILLALFATVAVKNHTKELRFNFATPLSAALSLGVGIGAVAALEMALLAWLTSGSLGPGRLSSVGVNPLLLVLVVFLEVAPVATLAAFYSARPEKAAPVPDYLKR